MTYTYETQLSKKALTIFYDYVVNNKIPRLYELIENRLIYEVMELQNLCDYLNIQVYVDYFNIIVEYDFFGAV